MTTLDSNVIRIRMDTLSFDAPMDDVRQQRIQFWRCNNLRFQLGVFSGDAIVDVTNFNTFFLTLRALNHGLPPSGGDPSLMFGQTSSIDTTVTNEDWAAGTKQHGEITFTMEDNAVEGGEYWISIWALTSTGHTLTLASGICRVMENGGVSTTPPKPKINYYTAEEIDAKLSNYYTQSEINEQLTHYYTKGTIDVKFEAYYTKTEIDDTFTDYYTAEQCNSRFEPIGGGGGGISPITKGSLVTGDGNHAVLLAGGGIQQLLIANPNETLGMAWKNYPWQLRQEVNISTPTSAVIFENIFNADLFWHYKLSYNFITTSIVGERLLMVYGYQLSNTTVWEESSTEYSYNTTDFLGNTSHYETNQFVDGFFGFGSTNAIYRNNGGWMHGEMNLWNDGNTAHKVQARATTSAYRVFNDTFVANGGIYNFVYKNAGAKVIRSLKIYVANGTLTSGRFTFYGIH